MHVLKDQKRVPGIANVRTGTLSYRYAYEYKSQEKDFYYERFVYRFKTTYNTSLLEISYLQLVSESKFRSYDCYFCNKTVASTFSSVPTHIRLVIAQKLIFK